MSEREQVEARLDDRWKNGLPWLRICNQDSIGPPGQFRTVRRLLAAPFPGYDRPDVLNLTLALYHRAPREMPPSHAGDVGCGMNLERNQVELLRDACQMFLDATKPQECAE